MRRKREGGEKKRFRSEKKWERKRGRGDERFVSSRIIIFSVLSEIIN